MLNHHPFTLWQLIDVRRPSFWFALVACGVIAFAAVGCSGCSGPRVAPGELPLPIPSPPPRPQVPWTSSSPVTVLEWDASDLVFQHMGDAEQVYLSVGDCETFGLEPPVRIVPRESKFDDPVDLDAYGLALRGSKPSCFAKELWRRGIWADGIFPPPDFDEREDRPNRYSDRYLTRPLPGETQRSCRLPRNWRPAAAQARKAAERVRDAWEYAIAEEARL